ncbi:hypothetical protein ACFXGR_22325 [Streptomyces mirabilis]|uniref:hypothetical protein n=1 Tax=Streptomyces mirabilis TaxID=68239 RepID=UPI0036A4B663
MSDLICADVILIALVGAVYCARRGIRVWRGDDYRTRSDRVMAERTCRTNPTSEQQTPGTDTDLLLDAALAYYGPAGLERLHDAINDIREEEAS